MQQALRSAAIWQAGAVSETGAPGDLHNQCLIEPSIHLPQPPKPRNLQEKFVSMKLDGLKLDRARFC